VGDYRVVCDILDQEVIIIAVLIGHRRDVYRE
jgi:mRNA interferase RelE/StbE